MINSKFHEQLNKTFYFDKKSKKNKKLSYCSLCRQGPFVEEDEQKEFFLFSGIKFCKKCTSIHNFKESNSDGFKTKNEIIKFEEFNNKKEKENKKQKPSWIVFTVECQDKSLYHGMSQDLEQAIKNINRGSGPKSLRSKIKRPVVLILKRKPVTKEEAIKIKSELT